MTQKSFVLISTNLNEEKNVLEHVKGLTYVTKAHLIGYGIYDIIAEVEGKNREEINSYIQFDMKRDIEEIRSTITLHVSDK